VDDVSLAGKKVIVTGASRGVGPAITNACAEEVATVLLMARDQEALKNVENEIIEKGGLAAS